MTNVVPISELKQHTGQILHLAVAGHQDIIVERYGQEYAVILSRSRYQELIDIAQQTIRERFLAAQREVHEAVADIPESEIHELVDQAVLAVRQARVGVDESRP